MRTPRSPATWLAATRPRFLSITVVAVLVGLASAIGSGVAPHWTSAALTLLGAVLIHAGANLVNDYHDREADAGNTERLFPFTGGSRMIQDGVFGARTIAAFGYALLAAPRRSARRWRWPGARSCGRSVVPGWHWRSPTRRRRCGCRRAASGRR